MEAQTIGEHRLWLTALVKLCPGAQYDGESEWSQSRVTLPPASCCLCLCCAHDAMCQGVIYHSRMSDDDICTHYMH